jgi:hypothetical protein
LRSDSRHKAVDAVLRLCADDAADVNGQFCWIDDPLQAPIASWENPEAAMPWTSDPAEA